MLVLYTNKERILMIKKLSKYGNSWALLIDKPILELLKIDESTKLHITTDGMRLIIERAANSHESIPPIDEKRKKLYEELIAKYSPALKKLAEN